jgi:hypothetical protein
MGETVGFEHATGIFKANEIRYYLKVAILEATTNVGLSWRVPWQYYNADQAWLNTRSHRGTGLMPSGSCLLMDGYVDSARSVGCVRPTHPVAFSSTPADSSTSWRKTASTDYKGQYELSFFSHPGQRSKNSAK